MAQGMRQMVERQLDRVQGVYEGHGRAFHFFWTLAAVVLLLAGMVMVVLPGPALVVVPLGLAMLAAQFSPARHLLDRMLRRLTPLERRLRRASPRTRAVAAAAAGIVALTALALLFGL